MNTYKYISATLNDRAAAAAIAFSMRVWEFGPEVGLLINQINKTACVEDLILARLNRF